MSRTPLHTYAFPGGVALGAVVVALVIAYGLTGWSALYLAAPAAWLVQLWLLCGPPSRSHTTRK